jgi:hypothetical protein
MKMEASWDLAGERVMAPDEHSHGDYRSGWGRIEKLSSRNESTFESLELGRNELFSVQRKSLTR